MKERLRHLLVETDGGPRRARLILALDDHPMNANQLAERLGLNYNTVRYHLGVLEDHGVVTPSGDGYGEVYLLTERFDHHQDAFEQLLDQVD